MTYTNAFNIGYQLAGLDDQMIPVMHSLAKNNDDNLELQAMSQGATQFTKERTQTRTKERLNELEQARSGHDRNRELEWEQ